MSAPSICIGHILCSRDVEQKIGSKHGISLRDVRDAVQWPARAARACWIGLEDDPRGPRAVVVGRTSQGATLKVVLYPVEDPREGTWRLGRAVVET